MIFPLFEPLPFSSVVQGTICARLVNAIIVSLAFPFFVAVTSAQISQFVFRGIASDRRHRLLLALRAGAMESLASVLLLIVGWFAIEMHWAPPIDAAFFYFFFVLCPFVVPAVAGAFVWRATRCRHWLGRAIAAHFVGRWTFIAVYLAIRSFRETRLAQWAGWMNHSQLLAWSFLLAATLSCMCLLVVSWLLPVRKRKSESVPASVES